METEVEITTTVKLFELIAFVNYRNMMQPRSLYKQAIEILSDKKFYGTIKNGRDDTPFHYVELVEVEYNGVLNGHRFGPLCDSNLTDGSKYRYDIHKKQPENRRVCQRCKKSKRAQIAMKMGF